MSWDLSPPPPTALTDRAVAPAGALLAGRRVALMVTGGIAAMRAPLLARDLRRQGATVVPFASPEALRYLGEDALAWACVHPVVTRLSPRAEHLSDEAPIDAYLVAPATYNTLNKLALGIADTPLLATLASALGRLERGDAEVLVAPTMHGTMHNRILVDSLRQLRHLGVTVVPPVQADGKDKLPSDAALVAWTARALAAGPLVGRTYALEGADAPDPAPQWGTLLDVARVALTHALADALWSRGAAVHLAQGEGVPLPAAHLREALTPAPDDATTLGWTSAADVDLRGLCDPDDVGGSVQRVVDGLEAGAA